MRKEYAKILSMLVIEPNLSLAAERLNVSQSSLSKTVKKMEESWDIKLFERKGFKGLQPSPEALALSKKMQQLFREWDDSLALVKSKSSDKIDLRVVGPQLWLQSFFIPYWFQSPWEKDCRLILNMLHLNEINLCSLAGHVDLVISNESHLLEDYIRHKIYQESFLIIFNKKYAPKSLKEIDPSKYKWIACKLNQDPLKHFFRNNNFDFKWIQSYINDPHTLLELVKTQERAAVCVPNHVLPKGDQNREQNIVIFEYEDMPVNKMDFYCFYRPDFSLGKKIYQELKNYCDQ